MALIIAKCHGCKIEYAMRPSEVKKRRELAKKLGLDNGRYFYCLDCIEDAKAAKGTPTD